jgi:GNAT superfamily N-acetyltransferase
MNIRFAIRQNGIVAFDEDKYVGHITVLNQGVLADRVGFVYVEPEYRRHKIASALYYAAALVSAQFNKVLLSDTFRNNESEFVWILLKTKWPEFVNVNADHYIFDLRDHAP